MTIRSTLLHGVAVVSAGLLASAGVAYAAYTVSIKALGGDGYPNTAPFSGPAPSPGTPAGPGYRMEHDLRRSGGPGEAPTAQAPGRDPDLGRAARIVLVPALLLSLLVPLSAQARDSLEDCKTFGPNSSSCARAIRQERDPAYHKDRIERERQRQRNLGHKQAR